MSIIKLLAVAAASAAISLTVVEAKAASIAPVGLEIGGDLVAQQTSDRSYQGNGQLIWNRQQDPRHDIINQVRVIKGQPPQVTLVLGTTNSREYILDGSIGLAWNQGFQMNLIQVNDRAAEGILFVGENGELRAISPLAAGSPWADLSVDFQPQQHSQTEILMEISATGSGQFSRSGTPTESLSRATIVVTKENYVAMSFRGKDNRLMRFAGQLVRRSANSLTVNFTNYGKAKATGTLNVQYDANNSISSLNGNGTIEGQGFSINFNNSQSTAPQNQTPQTLNLSQNGRGRLSWAGENRILTRARVVANPNGNVNISLRDRQNRAIAFRGKVMRRTANSLLVNLTDSSSFESVQGRLGIVYNANDNSISSLKGNGMVDGQQFTLNFNNSQTTGETPQLPANINLSQSGRGRFSLAGENQVLQTATVVANTDGDVNISLRDRQNQVISLAGQLLRRDGDLLLVNLTNSGSFLSVEGQVRIQYSAEKNEISSIAGKGNLDDREFSLNFSNSQTTGQTPQLQEKINLSGNGRGRLALPGTSQVLQTATVVANRDGDVSISLRDRQNQVISFSGQLLRRNADTLLVNLTNSGSFESVEGRVRIQYSAEKNEISSIAGKGNLDDREFSLNFSNSQTTGQTPQLQEKINLSGNGRGRLALAGENQVLQTATVVANTDGDVSIFLRDRENQVISFSGQLLRRDGDRLLVNLTNSGSFESVEGRVRIQYSADNNSISSIRGKGNLDGQEFSLGFNNSQTTGQNTQG